MLPVAALDRAIAFYTGLLGMKVKERHASETRTEIILQCGVALPTAAERFN
jgi:catechol 2,3-dioxygenase-like lactoylglutathione lyase family enzyme